MLRLLGLSALTLLAGCGGGAAPSASPTVPISATVSASPSGPATPTAGESAAAFWARRGVMPAPPAGFLDSYASLTTTSAPVRAALRSLSGEAYATDHLRLDLVASGVLGEVGLSGDATEIEQAKQLGLTSTSTTLVSLVGSAVVTVPAAQAKTLDTTVVVLKLQYGAFVGRYADGTSRTLPAGGPSSVALVGHLVTTSLLGTYLYLTSEVSCPSAVKGSESALACARLP